MSHFALIILGILIVITIGIFYGIRYHRIRIAIKRKRFEDRESLAMNDIYQKFYSDSGLDKNHIIAQWLFVAKSLDLDPGLLRPTDKFKVELGPVKNYPCPSEFDDLEEEIGRKTVELNYTSKNLNFETLDDYIRFMCKE